MVYLLTAMVVLVLTAIALLVLRAVNAAGPPVASRARAAFEEQRPRLLSAFQTAASASGKPRGLLWKALEWAPGVEFARERGTNRLAALVGVTVHFEATPGGDMEGVEAVGLPRNASAVFFYHAGRWRTSGQALFNVNPDEALQRFRNQYERVESEEA
jgi:hypothetical protein